MSKFTLGIKKQMLNFFAPDGKLTPATLIMTPALQVSAIRTKEKDGYSALQVGFGKTRREFNLPADVENLKVGDILETKLAPGDKVKVTGISKGKGFQGVVKRHGFHGGSRTHGQKHSEREPGSIGGGGRGGGRVVKGMRMAGRMGGDQVTVRNLKILDVSPGLFLVSGAVPGNAGTLLKIQAM